MGSLAEGSCRNSASQVSERDVILLHLLLWASFAPHLHLKRVTFSLWNFAVLAFALLLLLLPRFIKNHWMNRTVELASSRESTTPVCLDVSARRAGNRVPHHHLPTALLDAPHPTKTDTLTLTLTQRHAVLVPRANLV